MSEWGTTQSAPSSGAVGITEYRGMLQGRNTLCNTTPSLHNTTPALHKSPTNCTTLPMMHNSTSHWGQYKPDLGQAKVTTTHLFTSWRWSSLYHKQIPCSSQGFLRSVPLGFLSQGHNRIHTVQEGSHSRTPNHCKNYLVIEWTHWHWRQHQLMALQVTQSSDSDQHHTMTSTSEGPGPRGQVSATRKVKADTMHQWSEQQSSGLQCPYLVLVGLVPPATDATHTPSSVSTDLTPPPLTPSTRGSHVKCLD